MTLPAEFYARDTVQVARNLLGCELISQSAGGITTGRIVETEAYLWDDPAAHSFRGETARNRVMFGAPGHAYVYFIYGVHFCVNAVTGLPDQRGEAVLIRALEPLEGIPLMMQRRKMTKPRDLCNGPGKLCQALAIDGSLNGISLESDALQIQAGTTVPEDDIVQTIRVGITKAADLPLRFYLKGNPYISRK